MSRRSSEYISLTANKSNDLNRSFYFSKYPTDYMRLFYILYYEFICLAENAIEMNRLKESY